MLLNKRKFMLEISLHDRTLVWIWEGYISLQLHRKRQKCLIILVSKADCCKSWIQGIAGGEVVQLQGHFDALQQHRAERRDGGGSVISRRETRGAKLSTSTKQILPRRRPAQQQKRQRRRWVWHENLNWIRFKTFFHTKIGTGFANCRVLSSYSGRSSNVARCKRFKRLAAKRVPAKSLG